MPARRRRSRSWLRSSLGSSAASLLEDCGMGGSGEDALDGGGEGGPGLRERCETAAAGGSDGVVDAAAAGDRAAAGAEGSGVLEGVEDGVDDAFADGDDFGGAGADGLNDFVAVHLVPVEQA